MSVKIYSLCVSGLSAELVEVEADTGCGELGSFSVVGLPDTAISEARDRVRLAIKNTGLEFPKLKVTVNLAPANIRKQGSGFDLPIALSILLATSRLLDREELKESIFIGELALDGQLRSINGVLPMAIKARELGFKKIFLPSANAGEASVVRDIEVIPLNSLAELFSWWLGKSELKSADRIEITLNNSICSFDMAHIAGQQFAKRALEISAAGGHNLLMSGPPGSGKTMLARALPSILPDLSFEEALEVTKIYSVAGLLNHNQSLIASRPFRAPHHSASRPALIGGGQGPRPGEISLAHRGVLFVDEIPEMPRGILESLRQPLEDGFITVARATGNLKFPAEFILVAAMNPCPCGFLGDSKKECTCSQQLIAGYTRKMSGPILDRFDLQIEVPRLEFEDLAKESLAENSSQIKKRVTNARLMQAERLNAFNIFTNSEMSSEQVKKFVKLDSEATKITEVAVKKMAMSPRGYFRLLKTARTIADLDNSSHVLARHIAESLQYRTRIKS